MIIEFKEVSKTYQSKKDNMHQALNSVSFGVERGEFVFIIGHSGAGKTTLINALLKLIDIDKGKIIYKGRDISKLKNYELPKHRQSIGIVYQDFSLLDKKTVYENVAYAMQIVGLSKKRIRERIPDVLKLVSLSDKANNFVTELSIGERQRVAIARAIVNNPDILIADEPTGNLDPNTGWSIMKLLEQINNLGTTILMVTHNPEIVDAMKKRVLALEGGRISSDRKKSGFSLKELSDVPISAGKDIKDRSNLKDNIVTKKDREEHKEAVGSFFEEQKQKEKEKIFKEPDEKKTVSLKDLARKQTEPKQQKNMTLKEIAKHSLKDKKPNTEEERRVKKDTLHMLKRIKKEDQLEEPDFLKDKN